MKAALARWAGRALFLALHASLVALLVAVVIWPAQQMIASRADAITERSELLVRYEGIAAHEGSAGTFAREVRDRNARGGLLDGGNDGAASAGLQSRLKASAESQGATVRSVRALPGRALGTAQLIGARLELSGPVEAIAKAVHDIENGQALLVVTAASLRPVAQGRARAGEEPVIEAQFDVYGGVKDAVTAKETRP